MKQTHNGQYRVYDARNNYQQSYSASLTNSYSWARDCAKRVGGYVMEVLKEEKENEESPAPKVIFDFRA
jgi:hypothetical protein